MFPDAVDRITADRRRWRLLRFAAALAAVAGALAVGAAVAQTTQSMRIRSIGNGFAGILTDPHTDAFLNPARVGDLRDRQLYMARLPAANLAFYYPNSEGVRRNDDVVFPPESIPGNVNYEWNPSYTPYTIGVVTPLSASVKLSFALDAAASGYDFVENNDELAIDSGPDGERIDFSGYTYGFDRNLYHVVADVAIGTGNSQSNGPRLGLRLRVSYDQMEFGSARVNQYTHSGYPSISEISYTYRYNRQRGEYEKTRAELALGLFRNRGLFAQAVVGGGGYREDLANDELIRDIEDEDYDGNGRDRYGGLSPFYEIEDHAYDAFRTYDSFFLFGRVGLRWSDRVRSFHRVSWRTADGDGDGWTLWELFRSDNEIEERSTSVDYALDGTTTAFATWHSLGVVEDLRDGLLVALGVQVGFEREEFEEDGGGTGKWVSSQGTATDSLATPYAQRATYEREYWFFNLPIGMEWYFHPRVGWRFGTQVRATRLDRGGEIERRIGLLDEANPGDAQALHDVEHRISYETECYFSMGFEIRPWDRLSIDLLSVATTGSFNAANVTTAQLKYYF